ncbi:MAG: SMP-30/gluconolactonase/LRE family protein [Polyangiales bacterium]
MLKQVVWPIPMLAGLLALSRCAFPADETPASHATPITYGAQACVAAPALEVLAMFTPSPADVAVCPNGDVFVTLDGQDEVWRVPTEPAGAPVRHAAVTGVQPAGIACDAQGRLFVAAFALRDNSPYDAPGVLVIDGADAAPRAVTPPRVGFLTPNGIAAADGVGVYVSDTLAGTITLLREIQGEWVATIEARNLLGVNGLAYDSAKGTLYATNSLNQALVSFDVARAGGLSSQRLRWVGPLGAQLDEVEVNADGELYVAAYGGGAVYRVADESVVARLTHPASLAFHGDSLLITDYHLNEPTIEGGLYRLALGACGDAVMPRW